MAKDPKDAVLSYLTDQNRPFSANDVVMNMHKEHGKAAVQKALDALTAEGKVIEKVNGKQKAYVINQDSLPAANESELAALDEQLKETERQLREQTEAVVAAERQLKALESQPTNAEAKKEIESLEKETSTLKEKVKMLAGSQKGNVISKKDKENMERSLEVAATEWKKRKRMCGNVVDAILEGYPKSKKVFFEEVGIETDEEVGAKMPEL